jgi:hypothetical protein
MGHFQNLSPFRSLGRRSEPLAFLSLPLAQAHARAAAVLVDELDVGNLNRRSDLHRSSKNRIS